MTNEKKTIFFVADNLCSALQLLITADLNEKKFLSYVVVTDVISERIDKDESTFWLH